MRIAIQAPCARENDVTEHPAMTAPAFRNPRFNSPLLALCQGMAPDQAIRDNPMPGSTPARHWRFDMSCPLLLLLAAAADFVELGGGCPLTTNRPYCGS